MNRGRQLPEPGDGRKPFSVLDESPPFTANDDASTCESPAISVRRRGQLY